MRRSKRCVLLLLAMPMALSVGCSREPDQSATSARAEQAGMEAGPLRIVAVNAPTACFASRIGGDLVEVALAPPRDVDPAHWRPDADAIQRMQAADLIILQGAGHERWRSRASLPESKVVVSGRGFRDRWIEVEDGVTHSHGVGGAHTHKGIAPTTWLDLSLAIEQAEAIRAALVAARPDGASVFDANFATLREELLAIDAALEAAIHGQQGIPILFSHPVYQYLERRFALNGRSLDWEPQTMPDEAEWVKLAEILDQHPARWMVWEGEPGEAIRSRLRALQIEAIVFRPAGNLDPDLADPARWLDVQRENAAALAKVYE